MPFSYAALKLCLCLVGFIAARLFILLRGRLLMISFKTQLLDEKAVMRALRRVSHEIIERNRGISDIVIVGIKRRGEQIASLIHDNIEMIENASVPCASLDITFYRDDLSLEYESPVIKKSELPFSVTGKKVILVDDVIYTGRTVRAAIDALFTIGRPSCIQLAVLVDRGHRELPFRPDFVGLNVPTAGSEMVSVCVEEIDGEYSVKLYDIK